MAAAYGDRLDLGNGLVFEVINTDLDVDLVVYEFESDTDGVGQPNELKRVRLSRATVDDVLLGALDPEVLFGLNQNIGSGLVVSRTSADGDIVITVYDQPYGTNENELLKQVTISEAQAAAVVTFAEAASFPTLPAGNFIHGWTFETQQPVSDVVGSDTMTQLFANPVVVAAAHGNGHRSGTDGGLNSSFTFTGGSRDFTFAIWLRIDEIANNAGNPILEIEGDGPVLYVQPKANGKLEILYDDGTPVSVEITVPESEFFQLTIVYDGNNAKVLDAYVNGVLAGSTVEAWGESFSASGYIELGTDTTLADGEYWWDEFYIWQRMLTPVEVATLTNAFYE